MSTTSTTTCSYSTPVVVYRDNSHNGNPVATTTRAEQSDSIWNGGSGTIITSWPFQFASSTCVTVSDASGSGGGSGTTTVAVTLADTVDNPIFDLFAGFIVFFIVAFFIVYLFKKRT